MQISRRRRQWNLVLVAGLVAFMAAGYVLITQPSFGAQMARTNGPSPAVDQARLQSHVRMLSETLSPRGHEDVENLEKAADFIADALRATGATVSFQPYTTGYGVTYRNVIARVAPASTSGAGTDSDGIVIVGAHYDAYAGLPGADDNASGVAGLLELARMLSAKPPRVPVELVAFNTEEPPYFTSHDMGSAQHAALTAKTGVKVRGMIALEMIGCFSDAPNSQQFPMPLLKLMYPTTGNYISVVGKTGQGKIVRRVKRAMRGATDLPVESINAPRAVPGVDFSDHAPYWDRGFEAVMITDTAFYRNPRYHTPDDTWDTLDYGRMAKVVQGVFAAVHALAAD